MSEYDQLSIEVTFTNLAVSKTGETKFRFETPASELNDAVRLILFIEGDFAVGVGYEDNEGDRHEETLGMVEFDTAKFKHDQTCTMTFKSSVHKLKLPVEKIQELLERTLLLSLVRKVA